jgi:hypothetical protein
MTGPVNGHSEFGKLELNCRHRRPLYQLWVQDPCFKIQVPSIISPQAHWAFLFGHVSALVFGIHDSEKSFYILVRISSEGPKDAKGCDESNEVGRYVKILYQA